jgi:hypothetical protein
MQRGWAFNTLLRLHRILLDIHIGAHVDELLRHPGHAALRVIGVERRLLVVTA